MDAEAALRQHGFSGEQLLGLARQAASDALRRNGAFLDRDRREELDAYLAEVGARYAIRYDPSYGLAISTYLYRVMRRRYPDFLRTTLGDSRSRGRGRRVPVNARLPLRELDGATWEDDDDHGLQEAIESLGEHLSEASRATIREIAVPIACGWKVPELARASGPAGRD